MFIPKTKINSLIKALDLVIAAAENRTDPLIETYLEPDELEIVKQVYDKAMLVRHGDANFLEIEQYYGHKPESGI